MSKHQRSQSHHSEAVVASVERGCVVRRLRVMGAASTRPRCPCLVWQQEHTQERCLLQSPLGNPPSLASSVLEYQKIPFFFSACC